MTRIASESDSPGRPLSTAIPTDLDRGNIQLGQRPEHPVLAPGQPLAELLERVKDAVVVNEPHHVPGDAPLR